MRALGRFAAALLASAWVTGAAAHHVDPYEVAGRAIEAFEKSNSYEEGRAIFSRALRDARHDGKLDAGFAIVYAMYADLTRFDGNAAFALHLADQGLALALTENPPDEDMKNSLLVSRAYALAELGQYQQAVDSVAITALWMGQRFGAKQQADLEAMAREWAGLAATEAGASAKLPSAVDLSIELINKAQDAFNAQDTALAIALASRAMLPDGTNLRKVDVDYQNARAQMVMGAAYSFEGRHRLGIVALRRAVDLLSAAPWDGRSKSELLPEMLNDEQPRRTAWTTFNYLATAASGDRQWDLCAAALDAAEAFADTPERRFSILSQRALLAFQSNDFGRAEEMFRKGEAEAVASGDAMNAALARMYVGVARLMQGDGEAGSAEEEELSRLATAAAATASDDPQMVEYVLTTAVRMLVGKTGSYKAAMPLARKAIAVFEERQKVLAAYDAGQEANRRDRRLFLEMYIAGEYEESKAK